MKTKFKHSDFCKDFNTDFHRLLQTLPGLWSGLFQGGESSCALMAPMEGLRPSPVALGLGSISVKAFFT